MHQRNEWGPNDRARAEVLYSLHGYTKLYFDLLIDHPGEPIDADQITAYFAQTALKARASLIGDPLQAPSHRSGDGAGIPAGLFRTKGGQVPMAPPAFM